MQYHDDTATTASGAHWATVIVYCATSDSTTTLTYGFGTSNRTPPSDVADEMLAAAPHDAPDPEPVPQPAPRRHEHERPIYPTAKRRPAQQADSYG